jgi:TetR/AcrR family transcriptional regulator, transcriptional repressor for nem operon
MPRTADKTDIPRRLTEAGYALFNQHGFNATGIQQIADAAGVPKGSFYNHFESKEAFAARIIADYGDKVDAFWADALKDAPASPLGTIKHLFKRMAQLQANRGFQGCLVGNFAAEVVEASDACRLALDHVMADWRQRLAVLMAEAQAKGELRQDIAAHALAACFWDAWEGAVLRTKVEQSIQPLEDLLALMLDDLFKPCALPHVRPAPKPR